MERKTTLNLSAPYYYRIAIFLFCTFLQLFFITPLFAQSKVVSGSVMDANGNPLNGVTIAAKGGPALGKTDSLGNFKVSVSNGKNVLLFSSVGYGSKEEGIGDRTSITVTLAANAANLDEVVFIGYGTQKKRDVTGAITSVTSTQIAQRQPVDVFDAMQGQAPGLQIAQESGRPGAGSSVRIRGIGTIQGGADPLYVVDGAQGVSIDGINPADIESIEVLKDAASAAIYGSRSANGVVIITTKKGREGRPSVDVRYLTSASSLAHKIPQANAAERRLYDFKRSGGGGVNVDSLNPSFNADNDIQEMITRTAIRNQVDVSVSGGSKTMNYYGSVGYLKDEGIILNSYAKILRGRFNVDYKPSEKFAFGNRLQASYQTENRINDGNTLNQAIQRPPTFRIYLADGSLAGNIGGRKNPVAEALLATNRYEISNVSLYNYASYNFSKALKLTIDANVRVDYLHRLQFTPKLLSNTGLNNDGSDEKEYKPYWMVQGYFNYNKTLNGDHALTGVLGVSADKDFQHSAIIEGINYVSESVTTLNSPQTITFSSTSEERSTSVSGYGRLGYSYKGRYLFNSNFRADASSKFGKNSRWGFFPSASVGWRFSDESFMSWASSYLTDGKIRASYGVTGNDRIGAYDAIQNYTFGSNYYNGISGVAPNSRFGNDQLSWESTRQTNIGIDLVLLRNRLSITADYYNKITEDLLYRAPLDYVSGYNDVNVNVGSLQNKGFEFLVSGYPFRTKNLQWNVSYNMSFNTATVRNLYGNIPILSNVWLTEVGGSLGNFYGYNALGVYAYDESNAYDNNWDLLLPVIGVNGMPTGEYTLEGKPYSGTVNKMKTQGNILKGGDVMWDNIHKDGVIDDNDRKVLANAQPKWIAGLSNLVTYKKISLSFNFYMSYGGTLYNNARWNLLKMSTTNVTPDPEFIRESWSKPGDVTKWYISKNNGMGNSRELSSLFLEDASFIRLRNARVTYDLTSLVGSRLKMKGLSVYAYGNNLLTWTNYSWYDPEISFDNALQMGQDNGRYPRKREFGGGVNINF